MKVDIVFDTICPWCYVGKRRLFNALAERPGVSPEIRWRPFLLNPQFPEEGMEQPLYLERKFGGDQRIKRMLNAVQAAGSCEGIAFAFDRIRKTPNTMRAHRLIRFAGQYGTANAIVEAVFAAYFVEGRDIGRIEELVEIGRRFDLKPDQLAAYLERGDDEGHVLGENARAHHLGVNGVPCFIFNDEYAISGAQETEIFLRLIDLANENQIAGPVSPMLVSATRMDRMTSI